MCIRIGNIIWRYTKNGESFTKEEGGGDFWLLKNGLLRMHIREKRGILNREVRMDKKGKWV